MLEVMTNGYTEFAQSYMAQALMVLLSFFTSKDTGLKFFVVKVEKYFACDTYAVIIYKHVGSCACS